MKSTSSIWQRAARVVAIMLLEVAVVVGLLYCWRLYMLPKWHNENCVHETHTIEPPTPGQYSAILFDESCDTLGGTHVMTIKLHNIRVGSEVPVFTYDIEYNYPVVTWKSPNEIEVSVNSIPREFIEKQLSEVGGIKITYRLGIVKLKDFKPEPR